MLLLLSSLNYILSLLSLIQNFNIKLKYWDKRELCLEPVGVCYCILGFEYTEIKYLLYSLHTSEMNETLVIFPAQGSHTIPLSNT